MHARGVSAQMGGMGMGGSGMGTISFGMMRDYRDLTGAELEGLADSIHNTQMQEIRRMRLWLEDWYG